MIKGRVVERYEYAIYTEENQQRIKENKEYYRRRQAIVEHPFGTIKRQWGYTFTLLKGKEKVGGEFDLICLIYNIRRKCVHPRRKRTNQSPKSLER